MPDPCKRLTVCFLKWPDRPHWTFAAEHIDRDEHGTWLGVRGGTEGRKGSEPPVRFEPFVLLVPAAAWWTAVFQTAGPERLYVDIAAPAVWHEDRVEIVDLDLDVLVDHDGMVRILDEDEFLDHQVRFGYPPRLVAAARATTAEIVVAVETGAEPFARAGPARLAAWLDIQ